MTSSLVGSEMCIRDSIRWDGSSKVINTIGSTDFLEDNFHDRKLTRAVSYTHLTLPTICSV
eukprot:4871999-Prorocentrum_lima.AAC.1